MKTELYQATLAYMRDENNAYQQAASLQEQDEATLARITLILAECNDATKRLFLACEEFETFNSVCDVQERYDMFCVYSASNETILREVTKLASVLHEECDTLASEQVDYTAMLFLLNLLFALNYQNNVFFATLAQEQHIVMNVLQERYEEICAYVHTLAISEADFAQRVQHIYEHC